MEKMIRLMYRPYRFDVFDRLGLNVLPQPVSAGHTAGCRSCNGVVTMKQMQSKSHQISSANQDSAVSGQETPWLEIAGAVGLALLDIFKGPVTEVECGLKPQCVEFPWQVRMEIP